MPEKDTREGTVGSRKPRELAFRLPGLVSLPKPVSQFDQLNLTGKSGVGSVDFSVYPLLACNRRVSLFSFPSVDITAGTITSHRE